MEGPASASPGLRQIVSRAPANSACRGRDPRPRLYAGGSVAPAWRPHVLLPGSRQDQPAAAAAAAAACASPRPRFGEPHHSTSLLGRRRRPTGGGSDGGGGGRGGGRGGGGVPIGSPSALVKCPLVNSSVHWALGLGHWYEPSCLPQRLCASACRPRARRGPRWPDGHPPIARQALESRRSQWAHSLLRAEATATQLPMGTG